MFEKIRPEFQCLKAYGQNWKVWKDKARIIMFERIRKEFQRIKR